MTVQTSQQFLRYSQWTKYIWKIIQGSSRTLSSAPVCYGWLSQLDYSVARLDCIILKYYIYICKSYTVPTHTIHCHPIPFQMVCSTRSLLVNVFDAGNCAVRVALMASGSESLATSFGLPVLNSCTAGCPVLGRWAHEIFMAGKVWWSVMIP